MFKKINLQKIKTIITAHYFYFYIFLKFVFKITKRMKIKKKKKQKENTVQKGRVKEVVDFSNSTQIVMTIIIINK